MAQFSIREALRFSFSAYAKHAGELLLAACLVAAAGALMKVGPAYMGGRLGVEMGEIFSPEDLQDDSVSSSQGIVQPKTSVEKVRGAVSKVVNRLQAIPRLDLCIMIGLSLLFWFLHLFCSMGLMRLALSLTQTNRESWALFFTPGPILFKWIGASILAVIYFVLAFIAVTAVMIPFSYILNQLIANEATVATATLVTWLVLFLAVIAWFVGYILFGYCLLDHKATTSYDSLHMSQNLTRGSHLKLIGATIIMVAVIIAVAALVKAVAKFSGVACLQDEFVTTAIASIFTNPFVVLYLASIYRNLRHTKKHA